MIHIIDYVFLGVVSSDTVDELTRSHLKRYCVSSLGDMVYCKGCKQDRKEFTGTNKSCDICIERARKYKENNAESVKEGHAKYRANNRDMLNQRRRDLRATEEYRTKERERAKELGKVMYTCEVCNCEIKKWQRSRHEKTKKHKDNLDRLSYEGEGCGAV